MNNQTSIILYPQSNYKYVAIVEQAFVALLVILFVMVIEMMVVRIVTDLFLIPFISLGLYPFIFWLLARYKVECVKSIAINCCNEKLTLSESYLFERSTVQPMARIQYHSVNSNPLLKFFGLRTVKIFSAGAKEHTVEVPGISGKEASKLSEHLNRYSNIANK